MNGIKNKDTKKMIVNEGASTSAQAIAAEAMAAATATTTSTTGGKINIAATSSSNNTTTNATITKLNSGSVASAAAALAAAAMIDDNAPEDAICLFCKKKSENKLTAINYKKDILNALTLLTVEYEKIPSLTDYICYQCVFRVHVIIDFRRLIERNIKKSRANYYYNIGDKEKCKKYLFSPTTTSKIDNKIYTSYNNNSSKNEILDSSTTATSAVSTTMASSATENKSSDNIDIPKFKISNVRSVAATISGYGNNVSIGPNFHHRSNCSSILDAMLQSDFLFDCFNDVQYQSNEIDSNLSPLLEVLYEDRPQSVLVTESGGGGGRINNGRISTTVATSTGARSGISNTTKKTIHKCTNCSKIFTQSRFLKKHERQQHNRLHANRNRPRIHKCIDCNIEFQNLSSFKYHQKTTHQKVLECRHCSEKFFNPSDWELHEAVCYGKQMAINDNLEDGCRRYRTRSQYTTKTVDTSKTRKKTVNNVRRRRLQQQQQQNNKNVNRNDKNKESNDDDNGGNESSDCDSDEEIEESATLYNVRMSNIRDWVGKQTQNLNRNDGNNDADVDEDDNSVYEIVSSVATSFTRESSLSCISHITINDDNDDEDDNDDDGYDEKDRNEHEQPDSTITSTSTSITGRQRLNGIKRTRLNAKDSVRGKPKRRKNNNYFDMEEKPFTAFGNPSEFGYPHILSQPSLILPKTQQIFNCPEIGCTYTHTDLNKLMDHDIEFHAPNQLSYFYCKMCRGSFTRRFFYEQHLMYDSYGWYYCIKCEKKFDFQFQLKDHLHQHKISKASYKCEMCNLSFLLKTELNEHLISKKHRIKVSRSTVIFERFNHNLDNKNDIKILNKNCINNNITVNDETTETTTAKSTYRSEIKIINSMDMERSNKSELTTKWRKGVAFKLLPSGLHNCTVPSSNEKHSSS